MAEAPSGSCDHFWVIEGLRTATGKWQILYTFRAGMACRRIYNHFLELEDDQMPPELDGFEDFKIRPPLTSLPPAKEAKAGSFYTGGQKVAKRTGPSTARKVSSKAPTDGKKPKTRPQSTRTSVRASSPAS